MSYDMIVGEKKWDPAFFAPSSDKYSRFGNILKKILNNISDD